MVKVTGPLSIIIPSYMRNQVLWNTVSDLAAQMDTDDELIIVDQNTPALVPPTEMGPVRFRLIHQPTPSLTKARNLGIAVARWDRIVFLDDDIVPDRKLLANFKQLADEHPNCVLTGIVDQDDKVESVPTPGFVDLKTGEIRTNFTRACTGEIAFFPGCLVLIPRTCLPAPPFFCPSFRGASQGEEIDFALRIQAAGQRIVADPRIRIFHLKVVEGGCRAPHFRKHFFLDHVYNQGLFFGRQGQLLSLPKCLFRLKNFLEFHTRIPGEQKHSLSLAAIATAYLTLGLVTGVAQRIAYKRTST